MPDKEKKKKKKKKKKTERVSFFFHGEPIYKISKP